MVGVQYTICHWAINRTDPQNLLSTTLDVPLHLVYNVKDPSRSLILISEDSPGGELYPNYNL